MPIELTILGDVLRGTGMVYALVAVAAILAALIKPPGWKYKAAMTGSVIVLFGFLPAKEWWEKRQHALFAQEAWGYFKKLCAERAGEKIYKQQVGVRSLLVTKPLPSASERDLYDQFWYGDPYSASATSQRSMHAAGKLVYPNSPVSNGQLGQGLDFVELIPNGGSSSSESLVRIAYDSKLRDYKSTKAEKVESTFELKWEDISTITDRKYWVAGSRLSILDSRDGSLIAERIGYFIESGFGSTAGQRRPWLASKGPNTTCPYAHDWSDRWFVLRVLKPTETR